MIKKIDILLRKLRSANNISTQKQVLLSMIDTTSVEGQPFIEKLATLRLTKKLGKLRYWIQYGLVKANKLNGNDYLKSMLALQYSQDFLLLKESLSLIHELLNSKLIDDGHRLCWIEKIHSFSMNAVKAYAHRDHIASLVIELVDLKIDAVKMNQLLELFLSPHADGNFTYCDTVPPCFRHLAPYFNKICADYLSYKVISSRNAYSISQLIDSSFIDKLPCGQSKILFILTCLTIYQDMFRFRDQQPFGLNHPAFYIKNAELPFVLKSLLDKLEERATVIFFKQYLEINGFALTIDDECIQVYSPGGVEKKPISQAINVVLEAEKNTGLIACHPISTRASTEMNLSRKFSFSTYSMNSVQHKKQTGNYLKKNTSKFFSPHEPTKESIGSLIADSDSDLRKHAASEHSTVAEDSTLHAAKRHKRYILST